MLSSKVEEMFLTRSSRVKSVDLHPTETWLLAALCSGSVQIWNYESQLLLKSFKICDLPVRAAKFISRRNWIVRLR
ncbi:unnamed protein product [Cylicocyclus nassatus]|uniref:Uncharacterized protein n=1 Tax=Cylicocyclus nassatus TaxID=53992 RepID=A0AA36HC57_CYLNA|nr:unnamed protein product [Cylicocyclus nassatus]